MVILADEYGFCFGVERALEIAGDALGKHGSIEIAGEIIHNGRVREELAKKGLSHRDSAGGIMGKKALVRAHGMGRKTRELLVSRGVALIDATCPVVQRVYDEALECEEKGIAPVIFGNPGHPEIAGVIDHLKNRPVVISPEDDFKKTRLPERFVLIAQTTAPEERFIELAEHCGRSGMDFTVVNTICPVVRKRKEAGSRLAETCGLIIVAGARASANTKGLADYLSRFRPTIQVESAEEIRGMDFGRSEKIGLISGTSTPGEVVEEIFDDIEKKIVYKT
ncbi:MAG: 4-hydroxy-3-methylbut-2-enyl diphosphate reductase [Deltaproteobacteria bacterium]|nr:4-hydroxy-3-methylbut-2-enyl diphosphate reductase [Deltaproteobacteria bacterium]